jgi:8-oxo-dGTP pyrophosphatase MutT (NUDIX family)
VRSAVEEVGPIAGTLGFDAALRERIRDNLTRLMGPAPEVAAGHRRASVAIIITPHETGEAAFLLTRRMPQLGSHAGQQALPGGKVEAGESDELAARRETAEEIGLQLGEDALLGRLDPYVTRSGFAIAPFVYWSEQVGELAHNPDEVKTVRRVPLADLYTRQDPILLPGDSPNRPVLRLAMGERFIHAPTGAVLYQFREVALAGRYISVAHFDQPDFARR